MAGSTFGKIFRITTFGESHGPALGVVIDGCPAGLPLTEALIQPYLDRRAPGQNARTTQRKEPDQVEILSGVFEGRTTGTPIALLVRNRNQQSRDYSAIADVFRPGHADFGFYEKYGFRDYRGGGRSSGRETLSRVAGGAIAAEILRGLGITVEARCTSLGGVDIGWCPEEPSRAADCLRAMQTEDANAAAPASSGDAGEQYSPGLRAWCRRRLQAEARILRLRADADSAGGMVECRVTGLPAGLGEPVFDKLDARLAQAVMSIGAVKSVEIGDGLQVKDAVGSENNDGFYAEPEAARDLDPDAAYPLPRFRKLSNHAGGIIGGISDGDDVILRAAFKPTPSIGRPQDTANEKGENVSIRIEGRHDPTVVERAVVVVECMTALVLVDALLENMTARMEYLHRIYH